ncbi:hypothetical protein CDO52_15170 [Nocardiopsis gilva YIM 90087]|uniref:Uncharacterized protein n=1 Tax=Nocardiopsis gilva YIM 90087 TaxID=1235441 RepID=A0A223S769_9ACTN|nr:hypothetical protein [Nocardiopsis gilva]ASU83943.1 hypothetical protein CDO52_15170 [Nocardiopsis gilva YIM 90087]
MSSDRRSRLHCREGAIIAQPAPTPEALRAAVETLDPDRLGEFLTDLVEAKARGGIRPMMVFYHRWSAFAALHRFPDRLETLHGLQAKAATDRTAYAEISQLLAEIDAEVRG